ncbi:MAG: 4-hydroxy-tetrahydrodipicolinate synthase [Elusimicrobia bacterium]|nr:4-hydroxy-tetrahydrodipicolinate synthase [Elusimicrobiota bacterium]
MTLRLEGCFTALTTPFRADGQVDEPALRRLVRRQAQAGVSGLVPCGSTGEAATLTHSEFLRVLEITLRESQGQLPVIAGISANATWKALELSREAERLGADGLLALVPYYNKPTQEGMYRHFREIAANTRLPIIVYNIPGRTGVNLSPKTLARIASDCPNVVAVKEAAGSLDQVSEILSLSPKLTVLSGDDSLTLPMMAVGAKGVISVVSNIAPQQTEALCRAFLSGQNKKAAKLHLKMFPLIKALFIETNPIPIKAAQEMLGLCRADLRLPLTLMSSANRALLRREIKAFGAPR